jgi:hypothetical protein
MKVASGVTLTMLSCSHCDRRSWLADGAPIAMDDVFKITAGDPDFTGTPSVKAQRRAGKRLS